MRHRILFVVSLLLAMLISSMSVANAFETSTRVQGAYGVLGTVGGLVEIEQSVIINEYVRLGVSLGNFNTSPYADLGLSLTYSRFTAGISGAYVINAPKERLTGKGQFKLRFSVALYDRLSLVYTHFSNGAGIFGTKKHPNRGMDFIGLQFGF